MDWKKYQKLFFFNNFSLKKMSLDVASERQILRKSEDSEPLLQAENKRYTTFPIRHQDIWDSYVKHEASFWRADEIDLGADKRDWEKMDENEREHICHVLAFFAASDGIVMENLVTRFMKDVKYLEAVYFYGIQTAMENVHSQTYSLLIETYIKDNKKKEEMFNAIENYDSIKKKAQWALEWIESDSSFVERLVAFICVEGIFFSGNFASIGWLKEKGVMPGLCFSNELISRDEGMHTDFAILLFVKYIIRKPSYELVLRIFKSSVVIEKCSINQSLPYKLKGMNKELMSQYIEYVADRILKQMGYQPFYNSTNPFDFMENFSLEGKTNFFEKRLGEYQKRGGGEKTFNTSTEF